MSSNVESMFYTREPCWHGMGVCVQDAPTSEDALELAGLNWEVVQQNIYTLKHDFMTTIIDGHVGGYKANIRSTDGSVLGVVSENYQVVQNKDAFSFVDVLLGNGDVRYETAGSLAGGKRIWLLARMPEFILLDDVIDPYLVFTTGHDGRHLIRVAVTPVRVVCQNTLNIALKGTQRAWSTKHTGDMSSKLEDARDTLNLAIDYISDFKDNAVELANKVINNAMVTEMIEELFPMPNDPTLRTENNVLTKRLVLEQAYVTQDVQKFVGTKWGFINAVSDVATHDVNTRVTQESLFAKTIDGNPIIDKAYEILQKI